jgi:mannonate dehydratase
VKITEAKVIVCCPGRNFVTLKIVTDEGLYGLGDATLNGREKAVVSFLQDYVCPMLIGRDPQQIEDIWQYLYKGVYWRRGAVNMTAIAAVDTALWDIKGKLANMPLYQLLGGRSRDRILVYTHANGRDMEHTLEAVAEAREKGYKAIRVQSGIPGMEKIYGVAKSGHHYEPADADLPSVETWNTQKYLDFLPNLFAEVRTQFGDDIQLLHDVHHRLTPIEAARLGKELEPFGLFWLEDPTPAENQEAFKLIRQHTTTPLAVGEVFNTIHDCRELIQNQLIDFIRMSVVHSGGITALRRVADLASLYQVRTGCHGATDLSPVCMGAALHFDFWVPNFGIQEHMMHEPLVDEVFPGAYRFADGYFTPGEAPGHGVDIDEKLAMKFPYKRACLPVSRLEDGTLWNW